MTKKLLKGFTGLMVGIPLLGAAASSVSSLGEGTAKTMANTAIGIGSIGLVGESLKSIGKGGKIKW